MNYIEISATLENELGVDIPLGRITKVKSIQDLFDIVQELG
jgi:acyl carrier protein